MREGTLKVADCQLKAKGIPSALNEFQRGNWPWCTWVHARLAQGAISVTWSDTRLTVAGPGFCSNP